MGLTEIALKSAIPLSTVSRLLKSLIALGYVHYDPQHKKYRLTAKVLMLGYAAIAHSELQTLASPKMQALADETQTQVVLGSRDRLDVVLLETCECQPLSAARRDLKFGISVGTRLPIAQTPLGWTLLAALPELERRYLSLKMESRDRPEWSRIRTRLTKAQVQVQEKGFCSALGEVDPDIGVVAMPLSISAHPPMVLACIGSSTRMTHSRVEREFGPRMKQLVRYLQKEVEDV